MDGLLPSMLKFKGFYWTVVLCVSVIFWSVANCCYMSYLFQILHACDTDQRSLTFEKSIAMGKDYLQQVKSLVLRSAVLRNNIHVQVGSLISSLT